jgi:hypothetical protein
MSRWYCRMVEAEAVEYMGVEVFLELRRYRLDHRGLYTTLAYLHAAGTTPVYQSRFQSFPVETDEYLLTMARYVEHAAIRAQLVDCNS